MAENTAADTAHDDDLADEALDRWNGGKGCASAPGQGASTSMSCN